MSHDLPGPLQSISLRLPGGERYRLNMSSEELEGWLTPGRRPPSEFGVIPIEVEVSHAGGRAVIPVGAGELTRLLSRAQLELRAGAAQPRRPKPALDPSSGVGLHDPAARRLGPNADRAPDPSHHGPRRHRRIP